MHNIQRQRAIATAAILLIAAVLMGIFWSSGQNPSWHNIVVGKSTVDDLFDELGSPTSVKSVLGIRTYYYSTGQFSWAAHKVTALGNRVIRIEEDMSVYHPQEIYLTEFIETYGAPEYVAWSMNSPTQRVVVFRSQGVLVNTTALPLEESQITQAYYFRPCSMICTQLKFIGVFSPVNPFPYSDVVGTRDPWNFTQD